MNIKYILYFLFLLVSTEIYSQTILIEESPDEYDTEIPRFGPNSRNFAHYYVGFGFFTSKPEGKGVDIIYGKSWSFLVGYRYKLKLTNLLAMGCDFNYNFWVYHLKQTPEKLVPNSIQHTKEKIKFHNGGSDVYLRINIGKRGNTVGNFIDFGVFGNYAFSVRNIMQDKALDSNNFGAGIQKIVYRDLDYIERISYGAKVRLGFNRYVFFATYRMSDLFTKEFIQTSGAGELPRLAAGLQISIY